MTSTDKFVEELMLNIRANHPVTVVYTEDPFESLELIHQAVPVIRAKTDKLAYWSTSTGWIEFNEREKPIADQLALPIALQGRDNLKKTILTPIFASPEMIGAREPVFVVSLLSAKFKKDVIEVIQELRDFDYLTRNGVNESYRLIILANKSFELTSDYENLFGVITHGNPSREEIGEIYNTTFMKAFVTDLVSKVYVGDFDALLSELTALETFVLNTLSGLSSRQIKILLVKAMSACAVRQNNNKKIESFDLEKFKRTLFDEKFKELAGTGLTLLKPFPIEKVGGLDLLKAWLSQRAYGFSPAAKAKGIKKPKGALLLGLPGTGKSLIAKAMGGLLDRPTVQFDISSMLNSLLGSSEKRMRDTLATIDTIGSCVLFVDEIDKVFGNGTGGDLDGGAATRILGYFLTWLQETESDVFVIMSANRIGNIPPEMLRKGRFDEIFYVALPNVDEREEILKLYAASFDDNVSLSQVALKTEGFSSSELEFLVNEAALIAAIDDKPFTEKYLLAEVANIRPQAIAHKEDMERMASWAKANARPSSSVRSSRPKSFVERFEVDI